MAKKKTCAYDQAINILRKLKQDYPTFFLGQHISTALSDYGDIWGLRDEELVFALSKYQTELEYDIAPDKDLDKIIRDGENLDKLFTDEDDFD